MDQELFETGSKLLVLLESRIGRSGGGRRRSFRRHARLRCRNRFDDRRTIDLTWILFACGICPVRVSPLVAILSLSAPGLPFGCFPADVFSGGIRLGITAIPLGRASLSFARSLIAGG